MAETMTSRVPRPMSDPSSLPRLYVLDLSGGRIFSMNPDGTDRKTLVTDCRLPDGIAIDPEAGHLYWTDMGVPSREDGAIERADLNGGNRTTIVPEGGTFTPKQLQLDRKNRKLYWSDREGMRVMRANFDGSDVETLVIAGQGEADRRDQTRWCVGIAVDPERGHFYWTQKGGDNSDHGRIFRANVDFPKGETAATRTDIVTLFEGLPEPIDLELDLENRVLYWTDRGDPPRGNSVSRSPLDGVPRQEIVMRNLMEGIGIVLDVPGNRMFVTDLGGTVYSAQLDGTQVRQLAFAQGNLTGVAYAEST